MATMMSTVLSIPGIVDNITGAVQSLKPLASMKFLFSVRSLSARHLWSRHSRPFHRSGLDFTDLDISDFFNQISTQANMEFASIYNNTQQAAPSIQDPDVYFVSGTELSNQIPQDSTPVFLACLDTSFPRRSRPPQLGYRCQLWGAHGLPGSAEFGLRFVRLRLSLTLGPWQAAAHRSEPRTSTPVLKCGSGRCSSALPVRLSIHDGLRHPSQRRTHCHAVPIRH